MCTMQKRNNAVVWSLIVRIFALAERWGNWGRAKAHHTVQGWAKAHPTE